MRKIWATDEPIFNLYVLLELRTSRFCCAWNVVKVTTMQSMPNILQPLMKLSWSSDIHYIIVLQRRSICRILTHFSYFTGTFCIVQNYILRHLISNAVLWFPSCLVLSSSQRVFQIVRKVEELDNQIVSISVFFWIERNQTRAILGAESLERRKHDWKVRNCFLLTFMNCMHFKEIVSCFFFMIVKKSELEEWVYCSCRKLSKGLLLHIISVNETYQKYDH